MGDHNIKDSPRFRGSGSYVTLAKVPVRCDGKKIYAVQTHKISSLIGIVDVSDKPMNFSVGIALQWGEFFLSCMRSKNMFSLISLGVSQKPMSFSIGI
jgi:hypothetical protein